MLKDQGPPQPGRAIEERNHAADSMDQTNPLATRQSAGQFAGVDARGVPQAEMPASQVERVLHTVQQAYRSGERLRIQLHPPELGSVQVEIISARGMVHARLEVHTASAHRALSEQLATLRDALVQTGAPIDRIEVNLVPSRPDGFEGQPQPHWQGSQGQEHSPSQQPRREAASLVESDAHPHEQTGSINADSLDVRI